MSLDVSKLSMEQVKQLYSEGKLTDSDIAKLSPKEQAELASIAGEQAVLTGDELTKTGATQGKNVDKSGVPKETKSKKAGFFDKVKNFFKSDEVPTWKKVLAGAGAAAVGVGALAGLVAATSPAVATAVVAGVGALIGFASCTNINQVLNVDASNSNAEILQWLNDNYKGADADQIYKILVSILGDKLDRIIELLEAQGIQGSQLYDLMIQNGVKADKIIELLGKNNEQNDNIINILDGLTNSNSEMTDMLKRIYDAVQQGNKLSENNNEILTQILAKLETLGDNDDVKALLQQILDKVTQGVEQNKEMDTQTHDLLNQILSKLDNMDETSKSFFTQIMDKLDSLGDSNKAALAQILKAINTNTKVAQQTQVLVMEILNNLTKLGNKSDEILNLLAEISSNTASLDDIRDMLKDLLTQSKKNGEVLTDIDSKLSLISVTLNRLLTVVQSLGKGHEKLLAKLNEILAKIPDGCNCGNIDLTVIINKLDQLIEAVKNNSNDDKNHEGILEDLDDLLG